MQPDHHPLSPTRPDTFNNRSNQSTKPIPTPLSLVPLPRSTSSQINSSYSEAEDTMTARCSQFPADIHDSHPATDSIISPRYQPYLASINTDRTSWQDTSSSSSSLGTQSFRIDSPVSVTTNELSSSCSSSLASSVHPSSSNYLPSVSHPSPAIGLVKFDPSSAHPTPAQADAFYASLGSSTSSNPPYPPSTPQTFQAFTNTTDFHSHHPIHHHHPPPPPPPPQPRHSLSLQYAGPPAAAFTPSGGSPPLLPPNIFNPDLGTRRHTVSDFMPPSALDINLLGRHDFDETILKEEKRRRNKESSQRFRDRTRERQREKQERLEYLERRIKDLENQLKHARGQPTPTKTDPSSSAPGHDGQPGLPTPPPAGRLVGDHETALSAMQRLQRENESLRAALKTAEKEIHRLRPLAGMPSTGPHRGAFNISKVYSSLPQLSPPASTGAGGGATWSESSASPSAEREATTYFNTTQAGSGASSPGSESPLGAPCAPLQQHSHHLNFATELASAGASTNNFNPSTGLVSHPASRDPRHHPSDPSQQWDPQELRTFESSSSIPGSGQVSSHLSNWNLDPHTLSPTGSIQHDPFVMS